MPQFEMPTTGTVLIHGQINSDGVILRSEDAPQGGAIIAWDDLDAFTQGYIEAMFFTNGEEIPEEKAFGNLAPETLRGIIEDCTDFQVRAGPFIALAIKVNEYDQAQAGRDYWFTRNGHGCGFWDRGLGAVGDTLTTYSGRAEINPYIGDDGLIYLT